MLSNTPNKTLVFIPCYNCEKQIPRVIHKLDQAESHFFSEILILDNNSKDSTVQSAINALKTTQNINAKVAINTDNYGLGGSHKAAFAYALQNNFDHVVILHGDDQGDINDAIDLFKSGDFQRYDACLGSRFMTGSKTIGYSKFRIFGNKVFNLIFTIGSLNKVEDLGSGLNIVSKAVFKNPAIHHYSDDLRFNIYLLLGLFRDKHTIKFFPISWSEDDQVSNVKLFSQATKTITLLLESVFSKRKFATKDHRDKAVEAYTFNIVHNQPTSKPTL